ncbi:kinase-like protein, partial [Calocera cornea HHB12733]
MESLGSYMNVAVLDITDQIEHIAESPLICTASSDTWQGYYFVREGGRRRGVKVALKHLRWVTGLDASKLQKRFIRELQIWAALDHPNILPFYGTANIGSFEAARVCFVSPWMPNGSVVEYIREHRDVNRERLLCGIARGMRYLHESNPSLVHGDIKGNNILVDNIGRPLLCDFGLAAYEELERATTTLAYHGTMRWMAPERLSPDAFGLTISKARTIAADVFSFGSTAYEILSGRIPFHGSSDIQATMAI